MEHLLALEARLLWVRIPPSLQFGDVVELVDTGDLKSPGLKARAGSSPVIPTWTITWTLCPTWRESGMDEDTVLKTADCNRFKGSIPFLSAWKVNWQEPASPAKGVVRYGAWRSGLQLSAIRCHGKWAKSRVCKTLAIQLSRFESWGIDNYHKILLQNLDVPKNCRSIAINYENGFHAYTILVYPAPTRTE